jgi:hypothetical protein
LPQQKLYLFALEQNLYYIYKQVLEQGKQQTSAENKDKTEKVGVYKHLLTGVSYMTLF